MSDLKQARIKLTLLAQAIRGEAMLAARPGQLQRLEEIADEVDQVVSALGVREDQPEVK